MRIYNRYLIEKSELRFMHSETFVGELKFDVIKINYYNAMHSIFFTNACNSYLFGLIKFISRLIYQTLLYGLFRCANNFRCISNILNGTSIYSEIVRKNEKCNNKLK